jgi:hypothetical protein
VNSLEKKKETRQPPAKVNGANAQIAVKLRAFYHSVQEETLPQKFLDLLEKLDAVENSAQRVE